MARFGLSARSLVGVPFVCVLVVLAVIDLETRLLPSRIVLPGAVFALFAQIALFPDRTLEWIAPVWAAPCSCSSLHSSRPELSAWGM